MEPLEVKFQSVVAGVADLNGIGFKAFLALPRPRLETLPIPLLSLGNLLEFYDEVHKSQARDDELAIRNLEINKLTAELELEKYRNKQQTTLTCRYMTHTEDELALMFDRATVVEDWLPARAITTVWSDAAQAKWDALRQRSPGVQETTGVHPAFKKIAELVNCAVWEFRDTHNGWQHTTQDFVLNMKGRVLTPCNIGCLVELTGHAEGHYPDRSHKAKFVRDLLRMHVLRGAHGSLCGVITDMTRSVVLRISGPPEAPTLWRTHISEGIADVVILKLLNSQPEDLGISPDRINKRKLTESVAAGTRISPRRKVLCVEIDRLLGSGAQGYVYSTVEPMGCFIKHYTVAADQAAELTILQALHGVAGVPTVLGSTAEAPPAVLCSPVGASLSLHRGDVPQMMQVARACVAVLRSVHARHIVHRDLRLSNILLHDEGVLIIDWASASSVENAALHSYQGAVHFAADEVLAALAADPISRRVQYLPQHDLEGIVKTMFAAMYPVYVKALLSIPRLDFATTQLFWSTCAEEHTTLAAMLNAARGCDYDILTTLFTI